MLRVTSLKKKMIFLLTVAINCNTFLAVCETQCSLTLSSLGFCLEWIVQALFILSQCLAVHKHTRLLCLKHALSLKSSPISGSYTQFEHWSTWKEKWYLKVTNYILNMTLLFHFFYIFLQIYVKMPKFMSNKYVCFNCYFLHKNNKLIAVDSPISNSLIRNVI